MQLLAFGQVFHQRITAKDDDVEGLLAIQLFDHRPKDRDRKRLADAGQLRARRDRCAWDRVQRVGDQPALFRGFEQNRQVDAFSDRERLRERLQPDRRAVDDVEVQIPVEQDRPLR